MKLNGNPVKTRTISVQEGLSELKLLDKKIQKKLADTEFAAISKNDKFHESRLAKLSINEWQSDNRSKHQAVSDLIANRYAIKAAILKSNAETIVTINNVEMTVAEAIDRKQSIFEYERQLLDAMASNLIKTRDEVDKLNAQAENDADVALKLFLQTNATDAGKVKAEEIKALYTAQKYEVTESINNLSKVIDNLNDDIEKFLSDVDFALTKSNIITMIEIEDR